MTGLNINELLSIEPLIEKVDIEPHGYVYVRPMTGTERARIENLFDEKKKTDTEKMRRETIRATLCDSDGALLVCNDEQADQIMRMPCDIVEIIFVAAMRVSGIANLDETEKNSETTQP